MRAGELNHRVTIYRIVKEKSHFSTSGETKREKLITTRASRYYKGQGLGLEARELSDSSNFVFIFHACIKPYLSLNTIIEEGEERFTPLSIEENPKYRAIKVYCERLNE